MNKTFCFSISFLLLLILAIIGFWNTYFLKVLHHNRIHFIIHLHAVFAFIWIILLILQPILISKKKIYIHRIIGKFSKAVFLILIFSIITIVYLKLELNNFLFNISIFIPTKDLILLLLGACIAYYNTNHIEIHKKGIIITGISMIEPALIRLLFKLDIFYSELNYPITISIIYFLIILLIINDEDTTKYKFVYPFCLIYLMLSHYIAILFTL